MGKARNPRHGSMQYWPRKRAKRQHARIRYWPDSKEVKPLGFSGYKAGMTHIIITDNRKSSITKGMDLNIPVTILECPPLKVYSVRYYTKGTYGLKLAKEVVADKLDKELSRTINLPKNKSEVSEVSNFYDIRLGVYTQPKLISLKKKPEIFELGLGGTKDEKLAYAKEKLGKEITVNEVFKDGAFVDTHSITTGKGFQGPVKRFGIGLKPSKSEKGRRRPGSLGPWKGQGHVMYRVAQAGQMGYHQRTHYNKMIMKIGNNPDDVNPRGGLVNYGNVTSNYILIKGDVPAPKKRLVKLVDAIRLNHNSWTEAPNVSYISKESKQGR